MCISEIYFLPFFSLLKWPADPTPDCKRLIVENKKKHVLLILHVYNYT